jgi:hypothetical protein
MVQPSGRALTSVGAVRALTVMLALVSTLPPSASFTALSNWLRRKNMPPHHCALEAHSG